MVIITANNKTDKEAVLPLWDKEIALPEGVGIKAELAMLIETTALDKSQQLFHEKLVKDTKLLLQWMNEHFEPRDIKMFRISGYSPSNGASFHFCKAANNQYLSKSFVRVQSDKGKWDQVLYDFFHNEQVQNTMVDLIPNPDWITSPSDSDMKYGMRSENLKQKMLVKGATVAMVLGPLERLKIILNLGHLKMSHFMPAE